MKYIFLVHANTYDTSSDREFNYGYILQTDNRYPTPSDIERWEKEVKIDLEMDDDSIINILSFTKMKKEKK